jgi:pilus assembly protein CpaB
LKLFLSIILGLLAALFAAVLVGALASGPDGATALSIGNGQVSISMASRDLELGHVLQEEDIKVQAVPASVATSEGLLSKASVLGRVLIRPIITGQAISAASLASRGSGPEIESMLGGGLRATTVTLADKGPGTFVYPGSVVDVIAVFEMPSGASNQGEMVSRTVLEGVQVLAVDGYADAASFSKGAAQKSAVARSKGPIITLRLTPNQAQVLQLARNLGSLSVTLRSNEDDQQLARKTVSLSELLKYQPRVTRTPPVVVKAPEVAVDTTESDATTPDAQAPAEAASTPPIVEPEYLAEDLPEEEPWVTVVIRGGVRSTYKFEEKE